jgi:hypothetical protein
MRFPLPCRAAAVGCGLLLAPAAEAQVPMGSRQVVNTYTSGFQGSPEVAFGAGDEALVAWVSLQDGDGLGIRGRILGNTAGGGGAEFAVNTFTTGDQGSSDPSLHALAVAAGGDQFVVVWSGDAADGRRGLFGQRFGLDGAARGAEFRVDPPGYQGSWVGAAAHDTGGFLVVWESLDSIAGRRFDSQGQALGAVFRIEDDPNNTVADRMPAVSMAPDGAGVVTWVRFPQVLARTVSAAGQPLGNAFHVGGVDSSLRPPSVARAPDGAFMVVWEREGVRARVFDAAGDPLAAEFEVAAGTPFGVHLPRVAANPYGDFIVAWSDNPGPTARARARLFDRTGGSRSAVLPASADDTFTDQQPFPRVSANGVGNFQLVWPRHSELGDLSGADVHGRRYYGGLVPQPPAVDVPATAGSDGNGVLEAGERVAMRPAWRNATDASQTLTAIATEFSGPLGATYGIPDPTAVYGAVPPDAIAACDADCYELEVSSAPTRPAAHWDAVFQETLSPLPQTARYAMHLGDSFADVPRSSPFYPFVETILHRAVTAGCGPSVYCPAAAVARQEMAVFLLMAKEGPAFTPRECFVPAFADVPATHPFCRFISALDRRAGVAGCGGDNFCPAEAVTRAQMPVLVLSVLEPGFTPPACAAPRFNDVPASSPFCPWIEELARRGVVGGCGGGAYCPGQPVTRAQMSVFVSAGFGLTLHGP